MELKNDLVERFIRYVKISSQSNAAGTKVPTSEGQWEYARLLQGELADLGFEDIKLNEHCILTARLKGNCKADAIGFVSHLDTVDVALSPVVKPQIIEYKGGDVVLNEKEGISIKLSEHPELNAYVGQKIIFSDGTSVLGADNKAAGANIMSAFAYLKEHPEVKHGDIFVAFVPDEEIGLRGSKLLDLKDFNPDYAYTIDCCAVGEIVYETFNAGAAQLKIEGVSAHPMSAKGVLVNPLLVAHDFVSMFDRNQTPECTDKKDGYWWFVGIKSDPLFCTLDIHIRDFDKANYQKRKEYILACVDKLKEMYPRAKIDIKIEDVYENISNNVTPSDKPIAMLYKACDELGITPNTIAMRGGTDGSALSAKGLVTPNYFTGGHNFHSYAEFLPIDALEKSCRMTLKLIELAAS